MKKRLLIEGMSCQHCVNAITEELTNIGVNDVQVDLPTGIVYIDFDMDLTDTALHEAVTEAGFTLTSVE